MNTVRRPFEIVRHKTRKALRRERLLLHLALGMGMFLPLTQVWPLTRIWPPLY